MPRRVSRSRFPVPPLSQRLTLAAWFADLLGFRNNREMLETLRDCREEWDGSPHPVAQNLLSRSGLKIPPDTLEEMDGNIRAALADINRRRTPPVSLKYFQYLAALATENFLRRRALGPGKLLADLRSFSESRRVMRREDFPAPETDDELRKLALWVATGGGKTLLMHLNYRQFMRRRGGLFSPDNIILVTPDESLSVQHIAEMRRSGVPCFRHGEARGGLGMEGENPVRVLEITRLTGGKKGAVLVPTEEF